MTGYSCTRGITGHEDEVLARFAEDSFYVEMFETAFPELDDPIVFDSIIKSLASFIRAMISGDSPTIAIGR